MKLFEKSDTDFMAELEAATSLRPAAPVILMLFSVVALAVMFLIWASVSSVEVITRGQGQVVPTQEIQVVQSLEGGILSELLAREGEQVKKGQVLMRLSDTQFSSEERGTESKFLSLTAKRIRLQAEANGEEFVMPADITEKSPAIAKNEEQLYNSRKDELKNSYAILDDRISKANAELSEIKAQVGRMSEQRRMLQNELEVTRRMVEQKAAPKLEQMQKERELSDVSGQINAASAKQGGLASEVEAARKEKQSQEGRLRSQALTELNETETEIAGLQENLKSMGDRVDRREIRSPVDGVVNNIALTTIGGVVEPAMRLVEIVPLDDELKIVAKVTPDQVAFLHTGQDVKVKITAYDPQRYGSLPGKVTRIGANSVSDREGKIFFEIEVRTEKNYLGKEDRKFPITPGMVANTEVITGKRTILEYLLKPILRAQDVALTEH